MPSYMTRTLTIAKFFVYKTCDKIFCADKALTWSIKTKIK